ncbi:Zn(II)2Cys6 transcription factor domain-containing protein [Aspergillus novofumigatus IBT 16806]|uniref:Putative C6 finger domain protein n=1 Tax=Aspergillus novofumigatus (strain IBT 16806) TaxID=1392255 RepID=A0A2I1CCP1_ASPN1|nr:putative C6 finger domain protein [Aspergillus novofumigatus IBT 16806]PKX95398.1 putative C6 finger domain protein [Aspergillus novofumigatus IBT 16806]
MATDDHSDRSTRRRIRARHTKSRRGCFTCKGRRVKCDEIKPTCGACALRGEPCDWPAETGSQGHDTPRSQADSHGAKAPQDQSKRRAAHPDSGSPRPLQFDIASDAVGGRSTPHPGELNMVDLQLHSHFMLHTSKHMSLNRRRQHIWETVIPRFAVRSKALMHLLLALAGLDYASDRTADTQPAHRSPDMESQPSSTIADHDHTLDSAYLQIIIEHHQRGLEAFRTELANLSSANLNLVFAGSMLLVGFALASLRIRNLNDAHSQPGQPRLDWIFLIHGLCTVIKHNWPELRMGPLRGMTEYSYANDDWRLCPRDALRSVSSIRRGCSPRLVAFCRGADEALTQLVGYHASLADREGQILAEQKAALELLEGMYMRTLYVVRFSDEARESPLDVQADLEDAALMAWAEFLPEGFLDTLAGDGVCSTLSYVILAYFHLLFSLGFDGEIVKIKALVDMSAEGELVSLMQWPVSVIAVSHDHRSLYN